MTRKVEPNQNNSSKSLSLISDAKLKRLYSTMLKCRLLDEPLRQLMIGVTWKHLSSVGYEAALVGAAIDLRRGDWLLPQHRTAIAAILRGERLPAILSRLQSATPESLQPGAETLNPILPLANTVPPIGSLSAQLNIAIGLALAAQSRGKGEIVMAFCDSDAAAYKPIADTLVFAALYRLPLLVLALTSSNRPSRRGPSQKRAGPTTVVTEFRVSGIPVISVDQTDIVAMYRVAFESIHKARHGGGPTLIEAAAWPISARPDRLKNPVSGDPVARMEEYLAGKGRFTSQWRQSAVDRLNAEVALLKVRSSPK